MRILLAEDERITRKSLERYLAQWGHAVVSVEDGVAAWAQFQQGGFDAVLTDWQMPGLDGLELVRRIRAAGSPRLVYIVLLTSRSETADLIAGLDAGANDFLRKPFDRGELRARLDAGQRIIDLEQTLARQNARMQRDLDAAAEYVRSLIPPPLAGPVAIDWRYVPAGDLGGDTVGYHRIDDEALALYLLDVTGHGLDSALLSVTVINVIRSMSLPEVDFRRPAEVLTRVNERFPMEAHQDRCMTAWYGVYRPRDRRLTWSGAGHPPALLFSSGSSVPQMLASSGPMIGMLPFWDGADCEITVPPESMLYLYSDGVHEIERPDGTQWSFDEFVDFMGCDRQPDVSRLDELLARARSLRGADGFEDDFTILELRS